jgi:hypothetical protein
MKKRLLVLLSVLAVVALMTLPITVLAATPIATTTDITGTQGSTFGFTAPSGISLPAFAVGNNTGSSVTPGSIATNAAGWTLTVADAKANHTNHMTIGGADNGSATFLAAVIQVGMTSTVNTIAAYQTALQGSGGYGAVTGSFSIPLYVNQVVAITDTAGVYKITLTYTATPGF